MEPKHPLALVAVLLFSASLALATITYTPGSLVPANNSVYNTSANSMLLNFTFAATSNISTAFNCVLIVNGTPMGTNATTQNGTETTIQTNQSLVEGTYSWGINCTDSEGTTSSESRFVTVDTPPRITLVSPPNGSGQSGFFYTVTFKFTNDDPLSNTDCVLIEDGTSTGASPINSTLNSGSEYSISDSLTVGVHTWNVNCTESGIGTGSAPQAFTIIRDNINPSQPVLHIPNNTNITSASFDFNWTVTDDIDTSLLCDIVLDGSIFAANRTSANNTLTNLTVNQNNITQGSHTWSVTCRDDAGNSNSSLTQAFTYDSAPPTLTLTQPTASTPISARTNNTLTIMYTYTEARPDNAIIRLLNSTGAIFNTSVVTGLAGGTGINRTDTIGVPANATEGTYIINVTLSDFSGNVISSQVANAFVDNTAPLPSISMSDTTLNQNQVQSISCSATDNFGGNITVKLTDTNDLTGVAGVNSTSKNASSSSTGSKTATCNATDLAGNSAVATLSYTVASTSPGSGNSGSEGSGSGGGQEITTVVNTWDKLTAGVINSWSNILLSSGIITKVDLEVFNNVSNVQMTIKEISKPASITTEPGKAYKYFDITLTNVLSSNLKESTIFFQVPRSWLDSNGYTENEIFFYRWTGTGWQKLDTTLLGTSTSKIKKYSVKIPGYSIFAIFGVSSGAAPPSNATDAITPTNETTPVVQHPAPEEAVTTNTTGNQAEVSYVLPELPWLWIGVGAGVIIAAIAALKMLKSRRVPSGPKRIIVRKI